MSEATKDKAKTDEEIILYGKHEQLKTELLRGIHNAISPYEILYRLAEILERVSGEKKYAKYVEEQLIAVYGFALNHEEPLERELETVKARLGRIEASRQRDEFSDEEKIRMTFAIEAHKKNIARIEAMIAKAKLGET